MAARRWPFLYMSRDRREAVASSRGGHSSVTDVWVTLRSYDYCIQHSAFASEEVGNRHQFGGLWAFFDQILARYRSAAPRTRAPSFVLLRHSA
jgi:hypothetical protein